MKRYLGFEFPDAGSDFEQVQADDIELGVGKLGGFKSVFPEGMEQNIGGGVQEEAELVGGKFVAGGAVGFEVDFVVFDIVFHLAAAAVEVFVDGGVIGIGEIGDHEAGVVAFGVNFGFGHHPLQ